MSSAAPDPDEDDSGYDGRYDGIPGLVWYARARQVSGADLAVGDWLDSLDHRGARKIFGITAQDPDSATREVTFSFGDTETVRTDVMYDVVDPDSQVDPTGTPVQHDKPSSLTLTDLREQLHAVDVCAEQVQLLLTILSATVASLPDRLAAAPWGTDTITRAVTDLAGAAAAGLDDVNALARLAEQLQHLQAAVAAAEQLGTRVTELGAVGTVEAFLDSAQAGEAGQVETNPASGPGSWENAVETISVFLEDYGRDACPWGSDTVVLNLIGERSASIADAYARGTLGPDVCFPEDQLADLTARMDEVFQARRDQWCARHGLTGEQLVGLTLVDDAGHELTVTAVRRDDDLRWAIIGTITCPGCGSLGHGTVQENVEAAWATDEELRARYVYGWELPDPTNPIDRQIDPHDHLTVPSGEPGAGRLIRDDPAWRYQGLHGTVAARRLRVWQAADGVLVAVLTEGSGAEGTSLANAAEHVVAQLQAEYGPDIEVIEHQLPWQPAQPDEPGERWSLTGLTVGAGAGVPEGVEYLELPPTPAMIPGGLERVLLDVHGHPTWWPITTTDLIHRITGGTW